MRSSWSSWTEKNCRECPSDDGDSAEGLKYLGYGIGSENFDTVRVELSQGRKVREKKSEPEEILDASQARGINLRTLDASAVGITLDETTTVEGLAGPWQIFASGRTAL